MQKITIAVDVMGGDNAPNAIVEGSVQALREMPDISVTLCGPEDTIRSLLTGAEDLMERINIVHAPDVISMHEAPMLQFARRLILLWFAPCWRSRTAMLRHSFPQVPPVRYWQAV